MLTAPCRSQTPAYDEAKVVAYAKTIDIAQLDPTLESESFEKWLRLGSAHMEKLQWSMSDCDLKPDYVEPPDSYPLCTRVGLSARPCGWSDNRENWDQTQRYRRTAEIRVCRGIYAIKRGNEG